MPDAVDEDGGWIPERLGKIEAAPCSSSRERRGIFGELRRYPRDANGADHFSAAINGNTARIDRHSLWRRLSRVQDVGLTSRNANRRQLVAVEVENRSAARATAGVRRLARKRRHSGAAPECAGNRFRPRRGLRKDRVAEHIDAASTIYVLDA